MANCAVDPQSANAELRLLLKAAIGKAKRAAKDDREWWSTEVDTLCEKMAPLWPTCGIKTPGIWTDGGNKLHPSPEPCVRLKTLDPDTQAERGTILQSGRGEDAYNAPARAVLDLMDVAERWIDWLELHGQIEQCVSSTTPIKVQRKQMTNRWEALRSDLESLAVDFARLFQSDVECVADTVRRYTTRAGDRKDRGILCPTQKRSSEGGNLCLPDPRLTLVPSRCGRSKNSTPPLRFTMRAVTPS